MSGFEMRAQFYPLVTDLERLKEEAAEGVPYPFVTEELLELSPKDYRQFCSALGQRYAFETDIPKEGSIRCTGPSIVLWLLQYPKKKQFS